MYEMFISVLTETLVHCHHEVAGRRRLYVLDSPLRGERVLDLLRDLLAGL